MIYLDVTSSCKSAVNTGVQRSVRGIYRSLCAAGAPVTPLVWAPALASYCTLSASERGFLEAPFGPDGRRRAEAEPGKGRSVLSNWTRAVRRRWARVDLAPLLAAGDTLFVPEIFQDNRIELLPALPGRKLALCHDAIAWRRPEITPAANIAGVHGYLAALGQMSAVIAVSEETREDLLGFWRKAGKTSAPIIVRGWPVNHGGGPRPLAPAPTDPCPSILCVGTFEPRKNHLALLEAARLLWDAGLNFQLTLIGRTTAKFGRRVEDAIDKLDAAHRPTHWLRHVDDATLAAAYAQAAFTVFPSLAEGFGLPVLESLWHGRPCVCGSNGALGEVSAGGGCLNVDQTQSTALAAGMERLLNDNPYRRRLAEEARVRHFATWEEYAPAVLELLIQ